MQLFIVLYVFACLSRFACQLGRVSFSANVIMAVVVAVLCSIRSVSQSEDEEMTDIQNMVSLMHGRSH